MINNARQDDGMPALSKIAAEWQKWKEIVNATPVVRRSKIADSRLALSNGVYDDTVVLEETLDRMIVDMGVRFHD